MRTSPAASAVSNVAAEPPSAAAVGAISSSRSDLAGGRDEQRRPLVVRERREPACERVLDRGARGQWIAERRAPGELVGAEPGDELRQRQRVAARCRDEPVGDPPRDGSGPSSSRPASSSSAGTRSSGNPGFRNGD